MLFFFALFQRLTKCKDQLLESPGEEVHYGKQTVVHAPARWTYITGPVCPWPLDVVQISQGTSLNPSTNPETQLRAKWKWSNGGTRDSEERLHRALWHSGSTFLIKMDFDGHRTHPGHLWTTYVAVSAPFCKLL